MSAGPRTTEAPVVCFLDLSPGIEAGSERRPAGPEAIEAARADRPEARVFSARYVRPPLAGEEAGRVLPVVALAHPIARALHRIEHTWRRIAQAHGNGLPRGAELEEILARGLVPPLRRFPYANFHATLLAGEGVATSPAAAVALAGTLAARGAIALADVPATLEAVARRVLAAQGLAAPGAVALPAMRAQALPAALRHWRSRMPAETWSDLCRLHAVDLALHDAATAAVLVDDAIPVALRLEIAAAAEELAEIVAPASAASPRRPHATAAPAPLAGGERGEGDEEARDAHPGPTLQTLVEPDPVLGWRLRADHAIPLQVADAHLQMESDDEGCRPVPGRPTSGTRTVAAYGCSCVYGWAVAVEDTFCARLQARHPGWRIENHGVNGYGQGQNLLQLMRDLRWNAPDDVTFCWIAPHLTRNVGDIGQVQRQTQAASAGKSRLIRTMPRAVLGPDGEPGFRDIAYSRPELATLDLADFSPDPYYLDLVCAALMRRAARLVAARGGRFFVTVLMDALSPTLARLLREDGIPVVDAAVSGPAYINPFGLSHPNAAAHAHYAEAIDAYLASLDEPRDASDTPSPSGDRAAEATS